MATEELSKPTPVRFRQKDLERMDALARRYGGNRSALVRHLIADALDLELAGREVA
jgi:predicted DNA-binding protein